MYDAVELSGLAAVKSGSSIIPGLSAGMAAQVTRRLAGLPVDRNNYSCRQFNGFDTVELTTSGSNVVAASTRVQFFTNKARQGLCNWSEGRTTNDKPIIARAFGVDFFGGSITSDALSIVAGDNEATSGPTILETQADAIRTAEVRIELGKRVIWEGLGQDLIPGVGPTLSAAACNVESTALFALHNGAPNIAGRNFLPSPEVIYPDLEFRPTLVLPAAITFVRRTVARFFVYGERLEVGGLATVS